MQDNYDIHVASCKTRIVTIDSWWISERQRRSQGQKIKRSRPHEREAADFRPITRNADRLYEHKVWLGDRRRAIVIRYQD